MATAARKETEAPERDSPGVGRNHPAPESAGEFAHPMLLLQRTIGNRAAQRVLQGHGELKVSSPGDAHEREAEEVAGRVMRMAGPARNAPGGETSAGGTLPSGVRSYFEPRFGHDFSQVRVHAGGEAAQSAQALDARAYTVGNDIVFGAGEYDPASGEGGRLLAHELAHVVQQSGEEPAVQRAPATGSAPPPVTEHIGGTLWALDPAGKPLPPSLDDIAQGTLTDCFLFAAMAAIVNSDPQKIVHMIHDNGNGSYTVTFKGIGFLSSAKQTVTTDLVKGRHGFLGSRNAFWPLVIEAAYAKEKGGLNAYEKGGNAGTAMDDMLNDGTTRFDPREKPTGYILQKLAKAKQNNTPMTIGTPAKPNSVTPEKQAIANSMPGLHWWHAYVITDVDVTNARIKLFNPWGKGAPNYEFWIDIAVARKFFDDVELGD